MVGFSALKGVKSIHFIGIKGVGMEPLAVYAKEAGISVSGCDIEDKFITDEVLRAKGIVPFVGFDPKELPLKTDLVVATGAHGGLDNPQVLAAKKRGIPVWMQGEAVGKFMDGSFGISVTGSHGKTTTAGMLATLLTKAGLDPPYLVGIGSMRPLGSCGHKGKGNYFITEADEYANEPIYDRTPKFLYQNPSVIIVTNIDFDHPDLFLSIEDVSKAIEQFLQKLPKSGVAIVNGDDSQVRKVIYPLSAKVITFGLTPQNDFSITRVGHISHKTTFFAKHRDMELGEFSISIPGVHNCLNALAVVIGALELGLPVEKIRFLLPIFQGGNMRIEQVGRLESGAMLFDDYAHHPKEIKETILAAKQWFPRAKITIIFQPNTYSRTKALFNEFVHAFNGVDEVILTDIYPSLREEKDDSVSSQGLVDEMKKFGKRAISIPKKEDVVQYINKKKTSGEDIIFTMGAGDIYNIVPSLLTFCI
jgi:UDP-N-acetylmuramate--alanine ligase